VQEDEQGFKERRARKAVNERRVRRAFNETCY
jgi:hypothetical protein